MRKIRRGICLWVAILFFSTSCGTLHAQGPDIKMVLELPYEDTTTLPAETIVKVCSQFLENRKQATTEKTFVVLHRRGDAYLQLRKPQLALEDFDALCSMRPADARAHCCRASALFDLDKTDEAMAAAMEALRLAPKDAVPHGTLCSLLAAQGKWEEARDSAKLALGLTKDFAEAHFLLGFAEFAGGDHAKCVAHLNKYIEMAPMPRMREPHMPYYIRGRALLSLNRPRDGLANFLMARTLSPTSPDPTWGICAAYDDMGKYHLAAKASEDLLEITKDNPTYHLLCAHLQARIGKRRASETNLEKSRELVRGAFFTPPSVQAERAAFEGMTLSALGQFDTAIERFEAGLEIDAEYLPALRGKAFMFACCPEAKYRNGVEALKIAKTIQEHVKKKNLGVVSQYRAYLSLADAQAECADFTGAIASLRKGLELAGPDREVNELHERIELFKKRRAFRFLVAAQ